MLMAAHHALARHGVEDVVRASLTIDGRLLDSKAEPMTYSETGAMDGTSALFPDIFSDA